jgi:uncharacterized membrane protein YeaQ/YmgE (transglycosylase-associated protein family)
MGILSWIIAGLVIGALAKLIMPGDDPGGIVVTIVIGIVGAMVGGGIGRALGMYEPNQPAGWIMSIIGAIVLLAIYRMAFARPRRVGS